MDPVELEAMLKTDRSTGKQTGEFVFTKAIEDISVTAEECKKLCGKIGFKYEEGYESRIIQYKFTDATIDRYGDKIVAKGVKLDKYRSNPIVLAFHNSFRFPIGQTIKVWYDKASDSIKGWVLFLDNRVDDSGFADSVFKMAKSGVIKTGSIGFMPVAGKARRPNEDEKAAGMGEWSYVFEEIELLEYSIVPLPANPSSMAEPITKGFFTRKNLEILKDGKCYADEAEAKAFETMIDKAIKQIEGVTNMDPETEAPVIPPVAPVVSGKKSKLLTINLSDASGMAEALKHVELLKEEDYTVTLNVGNSNAPVIIDTTMEPAYIKAISDLMDSKAGAVLSKKNKTLVKDALAALDTVTKAGEALKALLKAAGEEDPAEDDEEEDDETDENKTGKGKEKSHKGSQNGDPVGGNSDPYGADFLGALDKGIKALNESAK